ncbi:CpsB/CapC family capsule biosynthesis tyrosine phosphatase [Lutibacter sp. TH_r2]|uniref:tyrosine-protein phosphatase n=1 Tax=Lutibacter sp. TH_r2 TaxID=3082083 RepID=UPI0029538DB4|nr:CpsB/CapC family capsule biosynthesis tyrosine phosphatase [Lutibacter sp. TH_r2]MDV7187779.1 CpsB/CapC family capsule biosynthesis tyrosine phosphatase [Lutibacter sp. TH_r2]
MITFLKKKKNLINCLPANFTEIHCHILPGIDDGAKNIEESIALLKRMKGYGIQKFICTPHSMEGVWENSTEIIQKQLNLLNSELKNHNLEDVNIQAAAEYMMDHRFEELLETEKLLTLKGHKILVEMSYFNPPVNLYELLFNIQVKGYQPVLAHPERYKFLHGNYKEYQKLKDAGCLFQLNLLSLTDHYGKSVQKTTLKLLNDKLYDFVGSDVHNQYHLDKLETIKSSKIVKLVTPLLENNTTFI